MGILEQIYLNEIAAVHRIEFKNLEF